MQQDEALQESYQNAPSHRSTAKRQYPDGGYGWVIVGSSFLLYLIADGISYPLGLINSAWLEYFKQSETKTSWIGSIFYATPLLSGPITSKLIDRYGCKQMTIAGGAVGAFGFIISSLCTSVEQLYITIGVIGGLGLSSCYIVGLLTVGRWFEAKRSLAVGIVSAGTGFGTFIFPPITQLFLDKFGWKWTVLLLSSLLMVVSLIGAFLDDPQWKVDDDLCKKTAKQNRAVSGDLRSPKPCWRMKNFMDFSHLNDRNFALLSFGTIAIYALYNTAIYFMTELLKDFDYTESESANFLSVIGFFLTLGMLTLGWSADRKVTNVVMLNAACVLGE
jgi:MFS family permease